MDVTASVKDVGSGDNFAAGQAAANAAVSSGYSSIWGGGQNSKIAGGITNGAKQQMGGMSIAARMEASGETLCYAKDGPELVSR